MNNLFNKISQARAVLIAGPCVIESEQLLMQTAEKLKEICTKLDIFLIFKSSFDKANRTSASSFRGTGLEAGLELLNKVKTSFELPILTDIHESYQAAPVAEVVDVLQIPAFLCRQTDLLVAAAQTGKIINVKKGQFLSGADMIFAVKKIEQAGNNQILLTERGNTFGYNQLVVDYTNLLEMKQFGYPVVFDATHSVQRPNGKNGSSGGNRDYAPLLAQAAAAVGIKHFFIETHPNPEVALSDGANMIYLDKMERVLQNLSRVIDLNLPII